MASVAVNLRGVPHEDVRRGDVLVTPGRVECRAARWTCGWSARDDPGDLPRDLIFHIGSAAVPVPGAPARRGRRPARPVAAAVELGDRAVLRDPATPDGRRRDRARRRSAADPPPGCARPRADELEGRPTARRRGQVRGRGPCRAPTWWRWVCWRRGRAGTAGRPGGGRPPRRRGLLGRAGRRLAEAVDAHADAAPLARAYRGGRPAGARAAGPAGSSRRWCEPPAARPSRPRVDAARVTGCGAGGRLSRAGPRRSDEAYAPARTATTVSAAGAAGSTRRPRTRHLAAAGRDAAGWCGSPPGTCSCPARTRRRGAARRAAAALHALRGAPGAGHQPPGRHPVAGAAGPDRANRTHRRRGTGHRP